ncbi:MAG: hypothetical protein ACD_23C00554G0001, partial [uncultured bacterium]
MGMVSSLGALRIRPDTAHGLPR